MPQMTEKLACCMIVKDEALTVRTAIESILPHVDQVFVYDTGSTDGTVDLLRELGVTVEEGEWRDDFSWAREQSFAMAEGYDWAFRLDADEELMGGEHLRELAKHETADGFALRRECDGGDLPSHPVTLVRLASGWRWQDPCHEILVHPDAEIETSTDVWVVHHGTGWNPERNLRIFQKAEEGGYESERFGFTFAWELAAAGRTDEAISRLAQWIEDVSASTFVSNVPPRDMAFTYSTLASWLKETSSPLEALQLEILALELAPNVAWTHVALAETYLLLGSWAGVYAHASRALAIAPEPGLSLWRQTELPARLLQVARETLTSEADEAEESEPMSEPAAKPVAA